MEKEPKDKKNYPAPSDYSVRNYCISKDIRTGYFLPCFSRKARSNPNHRDEDMISGKTRKHSKRHKNERSAPSYPPITVKNVQQQQRKPVVHVVKYEPGGRTKGKMNTKHIYCNTNVS